MGTREDKKLALEKQIYDAALDLFCEQGYVKTTLIDIAVEAQVSTRTLHNYFPTKDSILRKFGRENMLALKVHANELNQALPLKEQILDMFLYDYKQMFCLFDIEYVLHATRDSSGLINRFELENVFILESIYYNFFKREQIKRNIAVNSSASVAASIIVALYRHVTDIYRFQERGRFNEEKLCNFYRRHIDAIWGSLYDTLINSHPQAAKGGHVDWPNPHEQPVSERLKRIENETPDKR